MKPIYYLLALGFFFGHSLKAQVTEQDVFDHNLMFSDTYASKDYDFALIELYWLLENDENISQNVLIKGVRVLDANMKNIADKDSILTMQNIALSLYQKRLEKYGSSEKLKNNQLAKTYQYWRSNQSKYGELFSFFREEISTSPQMISNANLLAYMDVMRRVRLTKGDITDEQIIGGYNQITSALEERKSPGNNEGGYMEKIDEMFAKLVVLTCEDLKSAYGEKIKDDIESVDMAKIYVKMAITSDCKDDPTFHEALDYVITYEPSLNLVLYKAKLLLGQSKLNESESYFGKALGMEVTASQKSEIYNYLAKIYTHKEQKRQAQMYANKSLALVDNKEAHSILGNLYMSSFSDCAGDKDIVARRAVFLAAYDQFEKANDTKNMTIAKESFPSMEEIHFNQYSLGQKIEVDCWFNESVELRRRD